MDMYALINEREQIDSYGYASSVGVAFLRELELMQSREYSFSAPRGHGGWADHSGRSPGLAAV